ncbi:SPT2 chromatin protein-domain-containing protein [Lipomyces chichibuensis]|uniref:SPT2 chromatin protein-domain-containing protein n=1 Tax=Lipomyces chichibuensis TaxID=1546026 RepID=UPI003343103D
MFSQLLAAATSSSPRKSSTADNASSRAGPIKSTASSQKVNPTSTAAGLTSEIKPWIPVPVRKEDESKPRPSSRETGGFTSGRTISNDKAKHLATVERLKAQHPRSASTYNGSSASAKISALGKSSQANSASGLSAASASILATNRKKPNFLDILKEAEKVDSEKLKVTVKVRDPKKKPEKTGSKVLGSRLSHSPSPSVGNPPPKFSTTPAKGRILDSTIPTTTTSNLDRIGRSSTSPAIKGAKISDRKLLKDRRPVTVKTASAKPTASPSTKEKLPSRPRPVQTTHTPAPFAKPMEGLLKKRKAAEESDASLDDFIVSDEEQEDDGSSIPRRNARNARGPGYDRDEIWNLFRRGGRSRNYDYEDDDDNMEASGFDILSEELRSTAQARKEDEMMDEEERRLAEEKRKKRMKRP